MSRNVSVTRDAPEGDFSFSSAVPVEKLEDLYEKIVRRRKRREEEQGLEFISQDFKFIPSSVYNRVSRF